MLVKHLTGRPVPRNAAGRWARKLSDSGLPGQRIRLSRGDRRGLRLTCCRPPLRFRHTGSRTRNPRARLVEPLSGPHGSSNPRPRTGFSASRDSVRRRLRGCPGPLAPARRRRGGAGGPGSGSGTDPGEPAGRPERAADRHRRAGNRASPRAPGRGLGRGHSGGLDLDPLPPDAGAWSVRPRGLCGGRRERPFPALGSGHRPRRPGDGPGRAGAGPGMDPGPQDRLDLDAFGGGLRRRRPGRRAGGERDRGGRPRSVPEERGTRERPPRARLRPAVGVGRERGAPWSSRGPMEIPWP